MRILNWKKNGSDLESGYRLRVELGMIISLLILIVLFNIHLNFKNKETFTVPDQETVKMQQVVQTKINQKPPPPPVPQVPVAVPNDAVIQDQPNFMSSELNLDAPLKLPPPPPQPEEKNPKKKQQQQIFVVVEKMPKLIGGLQALEKNIQYPELARKAGIEGTVIVSFVVNKGGVPIDLKIARGVGGGLDQAAINAVQKVRFTPGIQRGRPVPVRMDIPVRFELENAEG